MSDVNMYERVTIVLTKQEFDQLNRIARLELRRPRDQAAYMLRCLLRDLSKEKNIESDIIPDPEVIEEMTR